MSQYVAEKSSNLAPEQDGGGRVKDVPRGNFQLMVHPLDWQLDHRGRLVPVIVQLGKEVGCGSVSARGNTNQHRLEHEQAGYVLIPHDLLGDDYIVVFRNERNRKVHRTVFELPVPGLDGTRWEFRQAAYDKFLQLLRLRGIVKAPQPQVVRELLRQRMWLRDQKTKRGPRAQTAEALDRYESDMRHLRETIAYLEQELAASIEVYGDTAGEIDSRLDDLLEAEVAVAPAVDAATREVAAATRPTIAPAAAPARKRGPRKERPVHTAPVAEVDLEEGFNGDRLDEDDE